MQRESEKSNPALFYLARQGAPEIRVWALKTLGSQGLPLMEAAIEELPENVLSELCEYLSTFEKEKVLHLLHKMLKNRRLIPSVVHALMLLNAKESIPWLIEAVEQIQDDVLVDDALFMLLEALAHFEADENMPYIVSLLTHPRQEIQMKAIELLGKYGKLSHLKTLWHFACEHDDPSTKKAVERAMRRIHERYPTVEQGWLSLSDVHKREEGMLSIEPMDAREQIFRRTQ